MINVPLSEILLLCLFLSAVLGICLFLFFSAKVDVRRVATKLGEHRVATERKTAESELRFNILETKLNEVTEKFQLIDQVIDQSSEAVLQTPTGPTRKQRTAIISLAMERKTAESEVRFNLIETKLSEVTEKLQLIDQVLERSKEAVVQIAPGPTQGKRTAVIRMAQKGESPDKIAASVGMPQNEVELLLKVHRAVANR
jgi:hypothetical protein